MCKTVWIGLGLGVVLIFLSPWLARIGSWDELKRWDAPELNPSGLEAPLYLSVEQTQSIFDPLGRTLASGWL